MPAIMLRYLPHILALAALVGGVLFYGHSRYNAGQADVRAEVAEQVAKATVETARIEAERDQISRKLENDILPRLQDATDRANSLAGRLRQHSHSRPMPQAPGAAPSPSGEAREPSGDGGVEQATERVFESCARDAERLKGWQDWYSAIKEIAPQA